MTNYTLYNRDGSGGFVVEAALVLADLPFELVKLDSAPGTDLPESFRAINPWRQVPVLTTPDGLVLTETAAILIHLAACHPDSGLGPSPGTPEHARFVRWLVFANVNVYEAVLRRVYPERYSTAPDCAESIRAAATVRMGEALKTVDAAIGPGPFLLGRSMCAADVYLAMLTRWFRGSLDAPNLYTLKHAVVTDPVVAPIWQRHFGRR